MAEFWEESFKDKKEMWGENPTYEARVIANMFYLKELNNILIPGFGYGRNAKAFIEKGMQVTGIEISETAIELAKKHFENNINIFHGSVNDMPFDEKQYDGIFSHGLIHLLNESERNQLINNCYEQLKPNGYMAFTAISTKTPSFGEGERLSHNRYKTKHGVELFYYDEAAVNTEFGSKNIVEFYEGGDLIDASTKQSAQVFWTIICKKTIS